MQDIVFGEYQEKDATEVTRFLRKIFTEMEWTVAPEDHIDEPTTYFYKHHGFLLVAERNEKVIGTAGILPFKKSAILKRFYIDQAYRGKGISKDLFAVVKNTVKDKGYTKIILDVGVTNIRARKFYEKLGFMLTTHPLYDLSVSSLNIGEFCFYQLDL